jgi:two-component system NtrC family sensor kinase
MAEALRLLLVEDDEDTTLLMRKALERAGHAVRSCRTAADALLCLRHGNYDLALLDQHLWDMTGLDLLQLMAREGIGTPAVLVTGQDDEQLAARAFQVGALDFIVKDVQLLLTGLPQRVQEALTRHRR